MAEYNGPDFEDVRKMLGDINAEAFQKIEAVATKALTAEAAKKGRGNKPKGSTRDARLKTALDLVAQSRKASVPVPESLVRLLADAVGSMPSYTPPDQSEPTLTQGQKSVIETLLKSPSLTLIEWKDGVLPTELSARSIAQKSGVSIMSVTRWWADPEFRRGLLWRIANEIKLDPNGDI